MGKILNIPGKNKKGKKIISISPTSGQRGLMMMDFVETFGEKRPINKGKSLGEIRKEVIKRRRNKAKKLKRKLKREKERRNEK